MKSVARTVLFLGLVGGGSAGVWYYQQRHSSTYQIQQLEAQKQKLEQEKQQLQTVVQRLAVEKRVAKVIVTDQKDRGEGMRTSLLFVEYARDGTALPGKRFTISGKMAHIDALVIKFDRDCVAQFDPLRGHSIAMFTRLFGETQPPEHAFPIDSPGQIPDVYRGDPKQTAETAAFEKELWQNFWKLADDKAYRESLRVRVANGQGIWGTFELGKLYEFTIEADGGLNMTVGPIEPIYREALQARFGSLVDVVAGPSTSPTIRSGPTTGTQPSSGPLQAD